MPPRTCFLICILWLYVVVYLPLSPVAKFTERATVLAESFMDALQEARAFVGDMRTKQNTLAKQLPQQTSVAGVQGVQQRSKQTLLDLRAGMEDWRNKLRVFMGPEASRVLQVRVCACLGCTR